jgi:YegS/Rv2252/BmrU family lipid kinase
MTDSKRYKLIANPTARRGGAWAAISKALELFTRKGVRYDLDLTNGPKEAGMIAKTACADYDVIVALGGDGTVNEVVQGMVFSKTPLGVIPCGSGNDFVKSLNIPADVDRAVEIVLAGATKVIDIGRINDLHFANGVGIGFDAAVTVASQAFRRLKGFPLYLAALVKALGRFRPVPMTIAMNGSDIRQDVFLLTIGNGTTCGGAFKLTPHARVDDGILDVTVVKPMSIPAIFRVLPDVFRGTIEKISQATMHTTLKLRVECAGTVPVHVDGEIFTEHDHAFEIEVVPKALTVIGNFPG